MKIWICICNVFKKRENWIFLQFSQQYKVFNTFLSSCNFKDLMVYAWNHFLKHTQAHKVTDSDNFNDW